MKTGIPALGIPPLDPLSIGSFSFIENDSYVDIKASFKDVVVTGLSNINFPKLSFDEKEFKISATATVASLKGTGKYKLDGTAVTIIPLKGDGSVTVEPDDVTMTISMTVSTFDLEKLTAKVTVEDISFDVESIKANLTNLEGGGDLSKVLNQIVNLLGKRIFDAVEPFISNSLESMLQNLINEELKKLHPPIVLNGTSNPPTGAIAKAFYRNTFDLKTVPHGNLNNLFDLILANANHYLASNGYDPWKINEKACISFKKHLPEPISSISGGAEFNDIEIYGISHLVRTGDVTLSTSPPAITINIGVTNTVHGGGHWKAWLTPIKISGAASVFVSDLSITATVGIENKKGKVLSIGFSRKPHISAEITGLGPLSWILTDFINDVVTPWLDRVVLSKIKDIIESLLDDEEILTKHLVIHGRRDSSNSFNCCKIV